MRPDTRVIAHKQEALTPREISTDRIDSLINRSQRMEPQHLATNDVGYRPLQIQQHLLQQSFI